MNLIQNLSTLLLVIALFSSFTEVSSAAEKKALLESTVKSDITIKGTRNGELRNLKGGSLEAWSKNSQAWISPKAFWLEYAAERGGLTWGERDTYPPYKDVKELDTMIIQLDSGICMMEFWHKRWRRANDVRRWDEKFTEYSACPVVFD